MPGLKQLQKLNSDLLILGDEEKIRAARGEKPVIAKIPNTVQDIDDSNDFQYGLPKVSEDELAAAGGEQQEDNGFSDFFGDGNDASAAETSAPAEGDAAPAMPDMSDLLSSDSMDLADLDLSDFEDTPEPQPEPEPEPTPIEDMDLDSLLSIAPEPEVSSLPEEDATEVAEEPVELAQDTAFEDISTDDLLNDIPAADSLSEPDGTAFDPSLFDSTDMETPADESEPQDLPEFDEGNLMNSLGSIGSLDPVDSPEMAIPADSMDSIDSMGTVEDLGGDSSPADDAGLDGLGDLGELNLDNLGDSLGDPGTQDNLGDLGNEAQSSEDVLNLDDGLGDLGDGLGDLNLDNMTMDDGGTEGTAPSDEGDMNLGGLDLDGLNLDSLNLDGMDDAGQSDDMGLGDLGDLGNLDNLGDDLGDSGAQDNPGDELDGNDEDEFTDPNSEFGTSESLDLNEGIPNEFNEIPDLDNLGAGMDPSPADSGADDLSSLSMDDDSTGGDMGGLGDLGDLGNLDNLDLPNFGDDGDASTGDGMESLSLDEFGMDDITGASPLSPEDAVPEELPAETFDTSDISGLDFSGESDFDLGDIDGIEGDDEFNIPGFSDTPVAEIKKVQDVQTPDFSKAADPSEKDKPKNTFTDNEYKRFLKNLSTYPLNVRIALEDFVVKNEFTDDAIFEVLEKVLRKAPARQVAADLEKLLDIQINVPRDFEHRSASEYEAYKHSLEYQLKNKIIPGAIMTAFSAIVIFCIFTLTNNLIYKPLRASGLYKQGYALLQENQYPQSEDKFSQALTFKPVKKWFYTYAEGYRDHKQYDRARMMYGAIIKRYNHEKKAGLDWAKMEIDELYNYEEGERILKREVLDYHINDADAILALGDLYLDWATEVDPEKFPDAKLNYDLLAELYGSNNICLSRQMRYFIRTDNLRQVLMYKEIFMGMKKGVDRNDEIELSEYMLNKRYGKLRPSEEALRSSIEDVRKLLERALKNSPDNAVALYNMGHYFVETNSGKSAAKLLRASIDSFEKQTKRNRRDTYKYINAYRLLGEEMRNEREYLTAEDLYDRGIEVFEREHKSSRFESNENVGHLYADLADLDYFIAGDNEAALYNYENAVNNKYDNSSIRYRIGYIQYQKQNYPQALGSFIRSQDTNANDTHLLLSLANTLSLSGDNHVARGYYDRLLAQLDIDRQKHNILLPQVREDQADIVDTYMKASNNLGVTLARLAENTGDSSLNAKAIVNLQESLRAWDALTRNQTTMIRLEGSNLAEQNIRYITNPMSEYRSEIYTEIPRTLNGEVGLE